MILRAILPLLLFFTLLPLAGVEIPSASKDVEAAAGEQIPVGNIKSDEEIRDRIAGIFSAVEGLKDIKVTVDKGVVTLRGEVSETRDSQDAVALANRTEGVVYVLDRTGHAMAVDKRLTPAFRKAKELWREAIRKLPLILIALFVLLLGWLVGKWLTRCDWIFQRVGLSDLSSSMAKQAIRLVLLIFSVITALEILDATAIAGAFLGVAGVMGVALGFAFRNIVENYLAGVLLSVRNPFSTGDIIEIEGFRGKVIRLTTRDTVLMTLEGNHLRIPNRTIIGSTMLNYTRNPLRRLDFAVGVSVEQDLVAARELGLETLDDIPAVLDDPAPWAVVEELGDSSVNMRFFAWIDQNNSDYLKSKSEAIRLVKEKFDDVGIEMPEPIYRVHLMNQPPAEAGPQPAKPKGPGRKTAGNIDTSVDRSIEEQIERVEKNEDEEDLLQK